MMIECMGCTVGSDHEDEHELDCRWNRAVSDVQRDRAYGLGYRDGLRRGRSVAAREHTVPQLREHYAAGLADGIADHEADALATA